MESSIKESVNEPVAVGMQDVMLRSEKIVAVIIAIGTMFLEAGAEVYRVEETMNRLGRAVPGVDDCVSYVTVTGVMCSIVTSGQTVTRIARAGNGSRNLAVINAINQLSRQSEQRHYDAAELEEALDRIKKLPAFSNRTKALFAAIGSAGFALFFKGTPIEIVASFLIGWLIQAISQYLGSISLNMFFVNALAAFATAFMAEWFHYFYSGARVNVVVISVLMLLVPGLTLTNALRDTMMGEYLSGVARTTEALLIAVSIALGVGIALYTYSSIISSL